MEWFKKIDWDEPDKTSSKIQFDPIKNSLNSLNSHLPSYEKGWEKVFPIKGNPYWRKDGMEVPIEKSGLNQPINEDENKDIQEMLKYVIERHIKDNPDNLKKNP
jgi:hypothetical protein